MRLLTIFQKCMIEQMRDRKNLALAVFTPIFIVIIFGLFFGKGFYTFTLAVSNEDAGDMGKSFVQILKEKKYDNGNTIFNVVQVDYDREKLDEQLRNHSYAAHVYIPKDFSELVNSNAEGAKVVVSGDPGYANFSFAEVYANLFLLDYINDYRGGSSAVKYEKNLVAENNVASEFDSMAPGLIIISVYFIMIVTAMVLARESEHKTMQRLLFSRLKAWELYGGVALSQVVLGTIMTIAAYGSTVLMGFKPTGSIWLTLLISLISNLSSIGIGLIIATYSKNNGQAFIIGNAVITPLFFISGVMMAPPSMKIAELFGRELGVVSFIPSYHSVEAIKKVLLNGAGLSDIMYELVFLSVLTLMICMIGIALFNLKYIRMYQVKNK